MRIFICDYCGEEREDNSRSKNKRFCNQNCKSNWHLKNNPKYQAYQKNYMVSKRQTQIAKSNEGKPIWFMRDKFLRMILGEQNG